MLLSYIIGGLLIVGGIGWAALAFYAGLMFDLRGDQNIVGLMSWPHIIISAAAVIGGVFVIVGA